MKIVILFIFAVLTLSASFLTVASEYASRAEIQTTIQQAREDLENGDMGKRLAAARTIQDLSRYAVSAVPDLAQCMSDPHPEVRSAAAYALEAIGPAAKAGVHELGKSLLDNSPDVRAAAAFAIGSIGFADKAALQVLVRQVEVESLRLSLAASFAIRRAFPKSSDLSKDRMIASNAIPLFFESLKQDTGSESVRLARAISTLDPAAMYSVVPQLISLAESKKNPAVAFNSANSLLTIEGNIKYYDQNILRLAGSSSKKERLLGLKEIGWLRISNPSAIRIVRAALSSSSVDIQVEAANALKHLGPIVPAAVPDLEDAVRVGTEKLRVAASEALLVIKPDALDNLMPFLWKNDPKLANRLEMLRRLSRL